MKGKHNVVEIEGTRCTVVESGIPEQRKNFLKDLLSYNGFEVKEESEKAKDGSPLGTFIIGVTDVLFNPVIALYQHKILRKDGQEVTPAYWNQKNLQTEIPYWQVDR